MALYVRIIEQNNIFQMGYIHQHIAEEQLMRGEEE